MAPTRRGMLGYLMGGGALLGSRVEALAAPRAERESAPDEEKTRAGVLQALLAKNRGLRPEFGPGYSNHVSMGLYALTALGGSAQQLRAFADDSWGPLEPLPQAAAPVVERNSFRSQLGQRTALNAYRSLFERELRQRGRAATLEQYLPELLPGLGAAAFHPLIRTGYGMRFDDARELADGLAYWATAYLPLGPLDPAGKEPEPRVLLQRLHRARQGKGSSNEGRLILDHLRSATQVPEFAGTVAALEPRADTLRKLALLALELYLETDGNFTALHAVTGSHGLRMLWPHVPQKELAARYLWQALVAAYLTIGAPLLPDEPRALEPGRAAKSRAAKSRAAKSRAAKKGSAEDGVASSVAENGSAAPDWSHIVAKVVTSTDAHDLKLVDVAREESAFYREPGYRVAAALRMRML